MAPMAKEPETLVSALGGAGVRQPAAAKPQPAAVEMPVTVNGARTVEGSDKREPFSENTHTVLVFANGAVIRLASGVASGQLLFLTNDRTKKEVVCQVVKSKNYSREAGYVELEFTEAAPGFWGMRFPAVGVVAAPVAAKLANPVSASAERSLLEKLAEEKAKAQSTPVVEATKPAGSTRVEAQERVKGREVKPAVAAESIALEAVPAASTKSLQQKLIEANARPQTAPTIEPPKPVEIKPAVATDFAESAAKIPTLSEFLTTGTKGPGLKASEKEDPAKAEPKANESAKPLTREGAELPGQLSSLIFAQKPELPVAAKISNVGTEASAGQLTKLLMTEKKEVESSASAPLPVKNPAP